MKATPLPKIPVIAIVDDDSAVREALSDLLQVEGLSGRVFDSADSFLADYAPDRYDCLITDVRMPRIGGLELQERLRALGSAMPVIVMTSSPDPATRARALEGGAIACLTKPVANEALMNQLWLALGRRAGRQDPTETEKPSER